MDFVCVACIYVVSTAAACDDPGDAGAVIIGSVGHYYVRRYITNVRKIDRGLFSFCLLFFTVCEEMMLQRMENVGLLHTNVPLFCVPA